MNRNFLTLFVIATSSLTGCPNNPVDDTGKLMPAWLTVNVSVLDEPVKVPVTVKRMLETTFTDLILHQTTVTYEDTDVFFEGTSGQPVKVKLEVPPDDEYEYKFDYKYFVFVGAGPLTVDNLPTVQHNGLDWVSPVIAETLEEGEELSVGRPLNRYFSAKYGCEYDNYAYDAEAPDFKGEWLMSVPLGTQRIDVEQGYRVHPHEYSTLGVMAQGDYMKVNGDQLVLVNADQSDEGRYITNSAIGVEEFSATVVNPPPGFTGVYDLNCWQVE